MEEKLICGNLPLLSIYYVEKQTSNVFLNLRLLVLLILKGLSGSQGIHFIFVLFYFLVF
jgi:hypothetical protein